MDEHIIKLWQEFETKLSPMWYYVATNKWGNRVYRNAPKDMWKIAQVDVEHHMEAITTIESQVTPVSIKPVTQTYKIISQDVPHEFLYQNPKGQDLIAVFKVEPLVPTVKLIPGGLLNQVELGKKVQELEKKIKNTKKVVEESKKQLEDATAKKWGITYEGKTTKVQLPAVSPVGKTFIEAIQAWKIVQYIDNKMFEVIVSTNTKDFNVNKLAKEQSWHSLFTQAVIIALNERNHESGAIQNGQQFRNKDGMDRRVKNPAIKQNSGHKKVDGWGYGTQHCPCPQCNFNEASIYDMVQILNDNHKWTREQIADWLDTLDEQPVFHPVQQGGIQSSAKVVTLEPAFYKKGDEGDTK
jgi:hypothetical protein